MSWLSDLARIDEAREEAAVIGRHTVLLASLVLLFVVMPAVRDVPGGGVRFTILFAIVLLAAIYVSSVRRWLFVVGGSLGIAAIAMVGFAEATGSAPARVASSAFGLTLLTLTILMMLNTLMQTRRVSHDTIVGGICVYLLLGLAFAIAYQTAMIFDPHALTVGGVPLGEAIDRADHESVQILYYSFVTLTTLGFGDITPHSEPAQLLTVFEAVVGQLYVAIFIARLMGLFLAQVREPAAPDRRSGPTGDDA